MKEYPEILITVMTYGDAITAKKNKAKTNSELTLNDSKGQKKYQLVSMITKDIKTGEIYAEVRNNGDEWLRKDEGNKIQPVAFTENPEDKLRLVAIYDRIE